RSEPTFPGFLVGRPNQPSPVPPPGQRSASPVSAPRPQLAFVFRDRAEIERQLEAMAQEVRAQGVAGPEAALLTAAMAAVRSAAAEFRRGVSGRRVRRGRLPCPGVDRTGPGRP